MYSAMTYLIHSSSNVSIVVIYSDYIDWCVSDMTHLTLNGKYNVTKYSFYSRVCWNLYSWSDIIHCVAVLCVTVYLSVFLVQYSDTLSLYYSLLAPVKADWQCVTISLFSVFILRTEADCLYCIVSIHWWKHAVVCWCLSKLLWYSDILIVRMLILLIQTWCVKYSTLYYSIDTWHSIHTSLTVCLLCDTFWCLMTVLPVVLLMICDIHYYSRDILFWYSQWWWRICRNVNININGWNNVAAGAGCLAAVSSMSLAVLQ
jgi:hypothetical protein